LYKIHKFTFIILLAGGIIRGRVLLDGDANKSVRVPAGSNLIVRFQDTPLADGSAIEIRQTKISDLVAFPFNYQIEIPGNISPALSYTLSARITNGETLLFINDQHISVTVGADSPITKDIPVISVNQGLDCFILMKNE
jgi:uncharacterized lipoprotein YbaY